MTFKSQSEMFGWIWDNRPHKSELTGKPLLSKGHFQWHWQFLHVLPKGSYPMWRLNPDNIILALPEEHSRQGDFEAFQTKYEELRRRYYGEFYNKEF